MPKAITVNPSLLRPNPWNANVVTPENEERIANSLSDLGQFKPIIVRSTGEIDTPYEILGGEHRWQQAMALGMDEVWIFDLGTIDDVKAKKITLADNARYGVDDTIELSKILQDIGSPEDIQSILPYSSADLHAISSSVDIALGDLELDDSFEKKDDEPEPVTPKPTKTHAVMRFKVPLGDDERLSKLIKKTQKTHGFTGADELTNAGDALVYLLLAAAGSDEDAA